MTRLTIEEFQEECGPDNWSLHISSRPGVLAAFMLEFDNPGFLAGPFGGKYGLVTITDTRKGPNKLCTQTEAYNRFRSYAANNLRNMPHARNDQAGLTTTHEYLSGRYDKNTMEPVPEDVRDNSIFFMTRNTLPGSATLDHPHLTISKGSSSEIDGLDMLRLFKRMTAELPAEEIIRRISEAEAKIEKSIQSYLDNDADSTPTVERPILLTLRGNDDSSWGKAFANIEDAMSYADELEASAMANFQYPSMNFTN